MLYCGKVWHKPIQQLNMMLGVFMLSVLGLALAENSGAVWLNASDAMIGVGLSMVLFVLFVKNRFDVNMALTALLIFILGYGVLRSLLFAPTIHELAGQMKPIYENYAKSYPQLHLDGGSLQWMQQIWMKYQISVWVGFQVLAVFFGLMLFNRTSPLKLQFRYLRFPFPVVYLMLAGLGLTLLSQTKTWGTNILVIMSMIYTIQGIGILSHFWGDFFQKARMMRAFLIMAIMLNYPVMILIAFIGVLDVWFDFRKLTYVEEKHEDNID